MSDDVSYHTDEDSNQYREECTQLYGGESQQATQRATQESEDNEQNLAVWGILKLKGGRVEYQLEHREVDGVRDSYTIGRKQRNDIVVPEGRVSSTHCRIYCDYESARLRVFVEDCSQNGTFVNTSLYRIKKNERTELKSGDEIYLVNPKKTSENDKYPTSFMFVNMRERNSGRRPISSAAVANLNNQQRARHVEDDYIIGDELGQGMCGVVHECIHRTTKIHYAVKIIDTRKFTMSPGLSAKEIREEANMMQALNHPNIIRIQETYETEHWIFIVMEYVKGGDLFDRIIERERYSESNARLVMFHILDAVSYLHSKDICHRDLKPENILLVDGNNDCDIKITDFGLAKRTNQEGLKTFCGTPQYFAPEVLKRRGTTTGTGRYGMSADMWSLGVVLYILLSGQFPFSEETLFDQIEHAQYSLTGPEWADISVEAKHFIRSLMTLLPNERLSVKDALQHPWITGAELPRSQRFQLRSAEEKVQEASQRSQDKTAKKKKTTVSRKNTGVTSANSSAGDKKGNGNSVSTVVDAKDAKKSTSTYQPLNSNCSGVLFWSYRSSLAKQISKNGNMNDNDIPGSANDSNKCERHWSQSSNFNSNASGTPTIRKNYSQSKVKEPQESLKEISTPAAEASSTSKCKKRKVNKSVKISPADSCFGDTKELSEDSIGEFSDHSEEGEQRKGHYSQNNQSRIEKYFTITSPSTVFEQSMGMSMPKYEEDDSQEIQDLWGAEGTKLKTSPTKKKKNTTSPALKKQKITEGKLPISVPSNKNSLQAAWTRAENMKRSKTAVVVDGMASMGVDVENHYIDKSEKGISSTGRQPMKTISDLFKNANRGTSTLFER